MAKSIIFSALFASLVLLASFAVVSPAFAAVNFDSIAPVVFDNGNGWESSVDGNAGDTFRVRALVDITSDSDANSISFDEVGDFVGQQCFQFDEVTNTVPNLPWEFDKEFATGPGNHNYVMTVYGVDGIGKDFNCDSANARDSYNVNGRVTTNLENSNTAGNSGGGNGGNSGGGNVGNIASLLATIADLQKQIGCYVSGQDYDSSTKQCKAKPAPAKPAYCDQMKNFTVWYGQTGGQVSSYQQFLISNGFSISAGATGYFGNQTQAAATAMGNACK